MKTRSLLVAGLILAFWAGCSSTPKRGETGKAVSQQKSIIESNQPPKDATQTIAATPIPPDQGGFPRDATPVLDSPNTTLSMDNREQLVNQFLEAALLEEKNQFDEAGKAYSKALEIVPGSSYLGAMTGKALLQSGKPDEAIKIAEEAIRSASNPVEAYKVLGLAYRQKKDLDKAITQYEKLIEIEPDSPDVLNELVTLYVRTQRYENAIEIYQKLAQIDTYQSFMYHYRIALILSQLGRYTEALDEYKLVVKEVPANFDVYLRIGKLYELLNQPDEAIINYLLALQHIRNEQDELGVRNALAPLYFDRKSYQEAIYQYTRIKERTPEEVQPRYQLARIYYEQEQFEKALQELSEIEAKTKGSFFIHILTLQTLEKLQRGAEGYQKFLEGFATSIGKDDWEDAQRFIVELTRKNALEQMEEFAQLPRMYELLEKSVEKFSEEPRPLFALASISLMRKEKDALQKHCGRILEALENARIGKDEQKLSRIAIELRFWFDVRRAFSTMNPPDSLTVALNKNQTDFPENTELSRTLASVYMDCNRWSDAESLLIKTKEHLQSDNPGYKDILYQLAMAYDKMNRVADIETIMNEAIQKFPDDSQSYNYLGYAFADRNIRLDEAIQLIQQALNLDPDDGNILDSMGWVYFRMGQIQEAVAYLEKAAAREENHPVILDHLGDARCLQGDSKTAVQCWKKALEYGPDFPYDFTPEFQNKLNKKIEEAETKQLP